MRFPGATEFLPIFTILASIIAITEALPVLTAYIEITLLDKDALAFGAVTAIGLADALGDALGDGVGITAGAAFTVTIVCNVFDCPYFPAGC